MGIYTKSGLKISNKYDRIVCGGRGEYIEINPEDIIEENIFIPLHEKWRKDSNKVYYIEYRTIDKCRIMIYYQKREVVYANYKIGYYYVYHNDVNIISEIIKMS